MSFFVIPAVDLKEGKCVRLVQGDPCFKTVELEDPLQVALDWEKKGASKLHLIDLDGALEGFRKNEGIVKEISSRLKIPVQFGGGIRSFEDASTLLDHGIAKIILGTSVIEEPELIRRLAAIYGKDRLIIALDSKNGRVVTRGWVKKTGVLAEDLMGKFEDLASECLFTNVDVEGKVQGLDIKIIKRIVKSTKLGIIASGGISSIKDLKQVKSTGASGAVIGTALYKGKIDLEKALKLEETS